MISFLFAILSFYYNVQAYNRSKEVLNNLRRKLLHPYWSLIDTWMVDRSEINDDLFHKYKNKSILFMLLFCICLVVEFILIT